MNNSKSGIEALAPARSYKILVAVAFDATGDSALREGIAQAVERRGAELHVVHAVSDNGAAPAVGALLGVERALAKAPDLLRARIENIWQEQGQVNVIGHIRPGNPVDVITQVAAEIDADLVVLGTHNRSGLQKLFLGSVGAQVVQHAHCAVLIAATKDHQQVSIERVEPACPDCLAVRAQSSRTAMWCERHSKPYLPPHVYVPRDTARESLMPTY